MRYILTGFFLMLALASQAQVLQPTRRGNGGNQGNRNDQPITNKDVTVEGEKPPITDYLILNHDRDTTYVDTTLSMKKDYKFNYLRKDSFELMPFPNIGQPYNTLGYDFDWDLLTPRMGARARHFNYFEIEDVEYYYVPTPLTELYFKTAIEEGQQLDALFTVNLSPQFNFSIRYKGVRSVGNYVQSDVRTGNFEFTSNYFTDKQRYRLKLHTTFQNLSNQVNGGLDTVAIAQFRSDEDDFENRERLETNLDDASIELDGRRFYVNHDFALINQQDSVSRNILRIYNKMWYEDKYYTFAERTPTPNFLGPAYESTINSRTDFEEGHMEGGVSYDNNLLGFYKAGVSRREFTYGYNRVIINEDETIPARFGGEAYQFKAAFAKAIKLSPDATQAIDFKGNAGVNFGGTLDGQFIHGEGSFRIPDFKVSAGIRLSSRAPDLNFLLYQSDYINYNWQNDFSNVEKQQLYFEARSDKFLDLDVSFTTLQDQTYFAEQLVVNEDGRVTGVNAVPRQAADPVSYLKVRGHRDFKFGNFGLDNTIMFQTVGQEQDVINVPTLLTRNTLYYKNRFFKNALLLQTGLILKYFTSYNMNGFDPVVGEFYTQNREEFGDFPMVDFFVNAKIQQTRIFFKLEHFNSQFMAQEYFSAPRIPYRDFIVRFGLVWNFFL